MTGGYIPPRSRFPRSEYDRRLAKAHVLAKAIELAERNRRGHLAAELREIQGDYAVPPRSAMAPDSPMFQSEPEVRLPSAVSGVPREPWQAKVIRESRWTYRLEVDNGALRHTYDDADPRAHGTREHAERKAKRIVDRLNWKDWKAERAERGGTIIT